MVGHVPKSVKRRVARLVEARKVATDMENEKNLKTTSKKRCLKWKKVLDIPVLPCYYEYETEERKVYELCNW
jgi:hypothetical protein